MKPRQLEVGDVVQIDPEHDEVFGASLMIVTEPKSWGAQGYVHVFPGHNADGSQNEGGMAYYRCNFEHMEYVGKAEWIHESKHDLSIPE